MRNSPASVDALSFGRIFQAGVLGAAVMSILAQISVWMSVPFFSIELFLGSLITGRGTGSASWLLGFAWHLINGGIFALFYRAIFRMTGRGGATFGALLGMVQWLIAGVVMPFIPVTHAHGFAWSTWGDATFFGTLVLHLSFGATVGWTTPSRAQARTPSSKKSEFDSSEIHQRTS
jgi:hypothetical protein